MILVCKDQSARLCQDGCWRYFANFGTYPECVKIYKSLGHALRRAKRNGGYVVEIPEGFAVDASGVVFGPVGVYSLNHFIVEKKKKKVNIVL